ncbi:hypothetical protein ACFXOL_14790 [Streptomyces californicus]|uniref:hypothetical protein n=1 Tax=Streptomyces californicus TaxID=67351 RepID=UPI00365A3D2F
MSPEQRLDSILHERTFRPAVPFGGDKELGTACLCLSECPPAHVAHLVNERGFQPWGLVVSREWAHSWGGGAVAYVPTSVHAAFKDAGLGHWAVRTDEGSTWMHEREWRVPVRKGGWLGRITQVTAILVADVSWRPTRLATGRWIDGETGLEVPGPSWPNAIEFQEYPRLWQESAVWVWNREKNNFDKHEPGTLC